MVEILRLRRAASLSGSYPIRHSEIDAIRRALEPAEREAARERQGERTDLLPGNFPGSSEPVVEQRARDRIGSFAGVSGRTVEKIAKVVDAAKADPERFGPLVQEMDKTGKVDGARRRMASPRSP